MRRPVAALLALAAGALAAAAAAPPRAAAQEAVTDHEGAAALGLALRRLGTTKRVLMVGAHPDDENTALIAELALGQGADVAYLSLTRGEGGQNLIGPELEAGLGLIRSEELLAARRLDGARQLFTRAIDFGYSKSAEDALRNWPRDSVLADVVRAVRAFRPDVVVSVFSGTPRDGHGQHQVAGMMAREAFEAAGDPARFPAQLAEGLAPHAPAYLYQALYRPPPDAPHTVQVGELDPLLGRSRFQVAMASRSRHRSQDMGQPEPPGPRAVRLVGMAGEPPPGGSLFAGLDTTLAAIAAGAGARGAAPARDYEAAAARARDALNPLRPDAVVPPLLDAGAALGRLARAAETAPGAPGERLRFAVAAEAADHADALRRAAGIVFEARVGDALVVPGQRLELELLLWNGGTRPLDVAALAPSLPAGWTAAPAGDAPPAAGALAPGELRRAAFTVLVPADARASVPYFLERPRDGALYRWPADGELRGRAFEPDPLRAAATVRIDGIELGLETAAVHVEVDKALGERRLPVLVVPAVGVTVSPGIAVVPRSAAAPASASASASASPSVALDVELVSQAPGGIAGALRLEAPAGWTAEPASVRIDALAEGATRSARYVVRPPAAPAPGEHRVRAVFEAADGRAFDAGYGLVDYPHTRPRALFREAAATVSVFPVALPAGLAVGYVEGAGDDVAEAIAALGADVALIDPAALAGGDLGRYDVIVTGIRAYEVRPDLVAHNARLLDWARRGGTLIVQYNKYELADDGYTPFPITMSRPHDRVADETAEVRLLDPAHPVLARPNRIGAEDFEGWVQERGLYFAATWDDAYTPLLEMADPGEEPKRGSLLVAPLGEGFYVYTGLSFFRQLPAGVPGAWRLLANLVALGAGR